MRMKYMYYLLKNNYDALANFKLERESYRAGGTLEYRGKVSNWQSTRDALLSISKIPYYEDFCNNILNNPYLAKTEDSFFLPESVYSSISKNYYPFVHQIEGILDFYEAAGVDSYKYGFDIKMPPTDNLDDFTKNLELLNKSINQCPYLKHNDEKVTLVKTDIGSIWFEFAIIATGASILLFNLSKLVDKCIKIKSHHTTLKQQEELWRQAKLKNDVLETLVETNKQVFDSVVSKCVEELKEEITNTELKDDDESRLKYSLETLSNLMDKGMEIYASIDSPPEVKDLFPTSDEMTFLPKPKELLDEKIDNQA